MVNFLCIPGKSERVVLDSNRAKVAAVGGELDEEVGNGATKTRDHSAGFPCLRIFSSAPLSQKEKLFHEQKRALVACNASVKHANLQFFLILQYCFQVIPKKLVLEDLGNIQQGVVCLSQTTIEPLIVKSILRSL